MGFALTVSTQVDLGQNEILAIAKCSGACDPGYYCPRGATILRTSLAQQDDLSKSLVARLCQIAKSAEKGSTAVQLLATKDHV